MDRTEVLPGSEAAVNCHARLYRRIDLKIIPILFFGYAMAYLDRVNIGFAALQMKADLNFTDAMYGLGAGLFFLGYVLFEVPSTMLLKKIGARLTMSRIMILWGVTSCCMMFVKTPSSFYTVRVLLGVFEAGFGPGVLLYLTFWYPEARIAQIAALFLSGATVAGMVGSPVSGLILDSMNDLMGLRGWQWLFLLEGAPAAVLGLLALKVLPDGPNDAAWLSSAERSIVCANLPRRAGHNPKHRGLLSALTLPQVYLIAVTWFSIVCGLYGVSFWMPMMLRTIGLSSASVIGAWSAIPYGIATLGMIMICRHSDRTMERRWHIAGCCIAGAVALLALPSAQHNPLVSIALMSVATTAVFTAMPLLWSIPMSTLPENVAPVAIPLINSIGLVGGFLSPFALGWVKTETGNLNNGLYMVACILGIGAIVVVTSIRFPRRQRVLD